MSIPIIKNQFNQFLFDKDDKISYLTKLKENGLFIRKNLEEVLKYFEIHSTTDWSVTIGFIINSLIPPAFVYNSEAKFIFINELKNFLES